MIPPMIPNGACCLTASLSYRTSVYLWPGWARYLNGRPETLPFGLVSD